MAATALYTRKVSTNDLHGKTTSYLATLGVYDSSWGSRSRGDEVAQVLMGKTAKRPQVAWVFGSACQIFIRCFLLDLSLSISQGIYGKYFTSKLKEWQSKRKDAKLDYKVGGVMRRMQDEVCVGFSFLNATAYAVHALKKDSKSSTLAGAKVVILDVDTHHGNGTQASFYDDHEVLTISMHRGQLWCERLGTMDYVGLGNGEGYYITQDNRLRYRLCLMAFGRRHSAIQSEKGAAGSETAEKETQRKRHSGRDAVEETAHK